MAQDYYSILGVGKAASQDEIKKAFRKLAHQYHPDKGGGNEAKFKEINEAYQVLSDENKRRQYDQFGHTYSSQGAQGQGGFGGFSSQDFDFGGAGFEDIFADMFGGRSRGRGRSRAGADIQVDVEITFEEMVRGTRKEIRLRKFSVCETCTGTGGKPGSDEKTCPRCKGAGEIRQTVQTILGTFAQVAPCDECHGRGKIYSEKCPTCHGEGRTQREEAVSVDIPAGIQDSQMISLPGHGAAGEAGAPSGDLFIAVHVHPHKSFKRQGHDIASRVSLPYPLLALGGKTEVETIDGQVMMKVPAGTQPGEIFRIRGKGIPHLRGSVRGDHLVTVSVAVPKKLTSAMKKALEALDKAQTQGK